MDHQNITFPRHMVIPAEFYNNTPFVRAKLNGKPALFLVDSGAQETLLNSRYLDSPVATGAKALGVTGSVPYFYAPLESLSIGEWEYRGGESLAVDLTHLEDELGIKIDGLIGFRQLVHFDWMVDYNAGEITLWERAPRDVLKVRKKITVRYRHHLPMVEVNINGHAFNFLVDTGAPETVFHHEKRHLIEDVLSEMKPGTMNSASPEKAPMEEGILKGFQVGELEYGPSVFWITDLALIRSRFGQEIDGVIGYALLSQYRTVVCWSNWSLWILE